MNFRFRSKNSFAFLESAFIMGYESKSCLGVVLAIHCKDYLFKLHFLFKLNNNLKVLLYFQDIFKINIQSFIHSKCLRSKLYYLIL